MVATGTYYSMDQVICMPMNGSQSQWFHASSGDEGARCCTSFLGAVSLRGHREDMCSMLQLVMTRCTDYLWQSYREVKERSCCAFPAVLLQVLVDAVDRTPGASHPPQDGLGRRL